MLDREYNIVDPNGPLFEYLNANIDGYLGIRRRAVIARRREDDKLFLLGCVIEAVTSHAKDRVREPTREYPEAVLYEDWLSHEELRDFLNQVREGKIRFGGHELTADLNPREWRKERVPLHNLYMLGSGLVFEADFERNRPQPSPMLVAHDQPYYPGIDEAAKDWLPFPVYHGMSDARNGTIVVLLPETRAFLLEVTANEQAIDVEIGGNCPDLALLVKGAWWVNSQIRQLEKAVTSERVRIEVPPTAERLDLVLMDTSGITYDYYRDPNYKYDSSESVRREDDGSNGVARVRAACQKGEGLKVEFKPFVVPEPANKGKKNKVSEVIRTVVAFANAKGGTIYFGIDDDCDLQGIQEELAKWSQCEITPDVSKRYLGVMRSRIRDSVVGDPELTFEHVEVDGRLIVLIGVKESDNKPVYIRQDHCFYLRRGASNTKVSPDQWESLICDSKAAATGFL